VISCERDEVPPGEPMTETTTSTARELTVRSVVLGGLITLVFTAANVYLGLKVGLTFATSIPAAVISMAVLHYFRGHTILENNIVQTVASAAGTLASIIFVLPGLIIIGWWQGFPYWTTVAVCVIGGTLGVMYSVPLRRALVTGSDLPYPEGVAAAEVLKVGEATEGTAEGAEGNRRSLRAIVLGALAAAGFSLFAALKVIGNEVSTTFRLGSGGTLFGASLSLALIGVGHLVGLTVGVAMLVGLLISHAVLLPALTWGDLPPGADVSDIVSSTFSTEVRFVGAGAIAVGAVWTLLKILGPIVRGIRAAAVSSRARRGGGTVELTERDLPIRIVGGTIVVALVPIAALLWGFLSGTPITDHTTTTIVVSLVYVAVAGAVVASVAGYMAGLIGSSNSPISGVGILVVLGISVLLVVLHGRGGDPARTTALVAYALFTTAVVFSVATISNDNLQDLKTGQLVGATPWKQQVALLFGVVFGALVIAPVLDLLNAAFGFAGAPGAGDNALAAPQATLISALAQGVFGGNLNWNLIGLGVLIGIVVIGIDEALTRSGTRRLPPLAVGMGMYLPMSLTLMIVVGALVGWVYDRWADRRGGDVERKKQLGVLMATGLIVGESLFGVVFAGIVAASGSDAPLAIVGESFENWAVALGVVLFAATVTALYRLTRRLSDDRTG
jgi:putative OPT family oligopeptide transporter